MLDYYIAYGSNLHPLRLQRRIPSALSMGVVELHSYRIRFYKQGADGSGKCMLEPDARGGRVFGAVYSMHREHWPILNEIEGAGYQRTPIEVRFNGEEIKAYTYFAETAYVDREATPYHWYKELVIHGARYHRFPDSYVQGLDSIASTSDPDHQRNETHKELIRAMARFDLQ